MYAISFIVGTVVLLMLSSLLAYLIYPLVELLYSFRKEVIC
jgi:hypothetical protein